METIYELLKDCETKEIKATGHIDPFEFCQRIQSETGIKVNIGDVKQGWERMVFKRNRTKNKPGHFFYRRCSASEFGANPVTFVKIENA